MENLPVVLVAQEWRRWAMENLQHNLSPREEVKVDLQRRALDQMYIIYREIYMYIYVYMPLTWLVTT